MSGVIRWEDPPPSQVPNRPWTTRRSHLEDLAAELRSRPGEWALVLEHDGGAPGRRTASGKAAGMATHIRLGQLRCFTPTGDFDAVTRKAGSITRVYARYVGEVSDAD